MLAVSGPRCYKLGFKNSLVMHGKTFYELFCVPHAYASTLLLLGTKKHSSLFSKAIARHKKDKPLTGFLKRRLQRDMPEDFKDLPGFFGGFLQEEQRTLDFFLYYLETRGASLEELGTSSGTTFRNPIFVTIRSTLSQGFF